MSRGGWNRGLTRETDERVARNAVAVELTYQQGRRAWAAGLTRESDERVRAWADKSSTSRVMSNIKKLFADHTQHDACTVIIPEDRTFNGARELMNELINAGWSALCIGDEVIVPSALTSIEVCGLISHSEARKSSSYLDEKSRSCSREGLEFIVIYEDEWINKRRQCMQLITRVLNRSSDTLSRDVWIAPLEDPKDAGVFSEALWMQSVVDGLLKSWVIRDRECVVAAASIKRPKHWSYTDALEIVNFCVSPGTHVCDALEMITEHVQSEVKEHGRQRLIMNWDKRFGSLDTRSWKRVRDVTNRFYWTDFVERFPRSRVRADSSCSLTRRGAANELGVIRVWSPMIVTYTRDVTH